ncbi:hypothetical protein LP421_27570 [Rhizobium sp. RCAM05350]|nr:hypothetical protein LP421_27570 [Rhizobium sp. RCAM05350]
MRLLPAFFASLLFATSVSAADLIHFWDKPQHGGNSFNPGCRRTRPISMR